MVGEEGILDGEFPEKQPGEENCDKIDPLGEVGCSVDFRGSAESFLGMTPYLLDSLMVAEFGATVGQDFYRKDRATMTKMLGPLPDGEWIACTWNELAHSKHLPSEYLQDSMRISRELTFYANGRYEDGSRFAMLTFPALDALAPVRDYTEALKKAGVRAELVRKLILGCEDADAAVVFERLEGEYRSKTGAIFWHYHMIIELGDNTDLEVLQRHLSEHSAEIAEPWAAVQLKAIRRDSFEKIAFYCAKPCQLAVRMAKAQHEDEFLTFLQKSKNRRMIKRWSGFKDHSSNLEKRGLRVSSSRDDQGREVLELVRKAKAVNRKPEARGSNQQEPEEREGPETASENSGSHGPEASHDNFSRCREQSSTSVSTSECEDAGKASDTEFCGVTGPVPGPGDRQYAFVRLRNFSEEALKDKETRLWWWDMQETQAELRWYWEENTGEAYDLKRVLRPFAHTLKRFLDEDPSNVHRPTITASASIHMVLEEILEEEQGKLAVSKRAIASPRKSSDKNRPGEVRGWFSKFIATIKGCVWHVQDKIVARLRSKPKNYSWHY